MAGEVSEGEPVSGGVIRKLAVLALAGTASCSPDGDDAGAVRAPEGVAVEPVVSSAQVPHSQFVEFALLGTHGVCLLDFYTVRVLCGDRHWQDVTTVAREGGGPGEIGRTPDLVSAPGGGFALADMQNRRVAFYDADREYVESTRLSVYFTAATELTDDSMVAGFSQPFPSVHPTQQLLRVDATTGVARSRTLMRFDPARLGVDTALVSGKVVGPDGRILATVGNRDSSAVAWFGPAGEFIELLDFPDWGTVYPGERDIEERGEDYRLIFRRPWPEAERREYAGTPLGRLRRGTGHRTLQVDAAGRAWVLGNRPSETGTFLELFDGATHLGSIELDGRVVGFQLADSILVALTEALEPGPDGLYPRRFDWYRVVERASSGAR
jgi:hypothetical protein